MEKFERTLLKFPRGSIWECDLSYIPRESGVQTGDRPVLIFSSDDGNYSSASVMCLTVTSNTDKARHSVNVSFINDKGEENLVLCNQMHTVSKTRLKRMLGILPEFIMEQVEEAHNIACGSKRPEANIECIEKAVNAIIVAYERRSLLERNKVALEQEQVNKIAAQLEELFRDVVIPLDKAKKEAPILTAYAESKPNQAEQDSEEKKTTEVVETKKVAKAEEEAPKDTVNTEVKKNKNGANREKSVNTERKPKGYWTDERKAEFIADKNNMSAEELMAKWKFTSVKSIYTMYYVFRRDLDAGKNGGNS